ncbi:MAG: sensor histidine kinase [Blautia sp.]
MKVKVWADEDLHILVEDRGVGFDVEEWRRKPGKKEEHTNIGIHNVEEMIHMEYGENYGMWIESRPGEGTRVTYLLLGRQGKKHDTDNYSG